MTKPGRRRLLSCQRRGEHVVFSAADFEEFRARDRTAPHHESELKAVVRHLVENRWRFGITYDVERDHRAGIDVYEG